MYFVHTHNLWLFKKIDYTCHIVSYPVFAEEQAAQEASTEQTQATTIDPNDIDALENRRQELQAQSDKYPVSYTHLDVYKRQGKTCARS